MKSVLFDGTAMQSSRLAKYHGGGEYAKFVFKAALKSGYEFDVVINPGLSLDSHILELIKSKNITVIEATTKEQIYSIIKNRRYNIFYSALPYQYYDYTPTNRFIGVIHGLRQIEIVWDRYKHYYYKSTIMKTIGWTINKCSIIQKYLFYRKKRCLGKLINLPNSEFITVSNHTKYSIMNFFPSINEGNITVYYSPFDFPKSCNESANCVSDKYFLLLSGNRFEKNTFRAIKSFDKLFNDGRLKNFKVVITGAEKLPFENKIQNRENFILLPYVAKEKLENLFRNAFCFVYPSLNEGFGYPPLIAMSYSVPVIASCSTSIPEVCDDSAIYFNPLNTDELCNRILQVTNSSILRNCLIKRGLKRVNQLQEKQHKELAKYLAHIFR